MAFFFFLANQEGTMKETIAETTAVVIHPPMHSCTTSSVGSLHSPISKAPWQMPLFKYGPGEEAWLWLCLPQKEGKQN